MPAATMDQNGIVWWVLGALVLIPLMPGMSQMVFVIGQEQWMSLLGHIIYGLVTSFVFIPLVKRGQGTIPSWRAFLPAMRGPTPKEPGHDLVAPTTFWSAILRQAVILQPSIT